MLGLQVQVSRRLAEIPRSRFVHRDRRRRGPRMGRLQMFQDDFGQELGLPRLDVGVQGGCEQVFPQRTQPECAADFQFLQ